MNSALTHALPARHSIPLVGAIQFVYILDFMMVLPLGPDIAQAFGFPADRVGWLSATYTLASMLAGLAATRLLDRFDRRQALLATLAGLGIATLACAFARDPASLLAMRALTGFFGAPTVALAMAVLIDTTPPAARGAAIGKAMIGFSLAAIAGVPFALELARHGNWATPFLAVALMCAAVWLAAWLLLPPLRSHLGAPARASLRSLLSQPAIRAACTVQALNQFSAFLVIPAFSAFFLLNLDWPRDELGTLYLAGGLCALLCIQVAGRLTDRIGSLRTVALATAGFIGGLFPMLGWNALPAMLPFVLFMASNAARNVSVAAACSQIPAPQERAGFMLLQSMVQDLAIAAAALLSSLMLRTAPDGSLVGMPGLAALAAGCAALLLPGLARLGRIPA